MFERKEGEKKLFKNKEHVIIPKGSYSYEFSGYYGAKKVILESPVRGKIIHPSKYDYSLGRMVKLDLRTYNCLTSEFSYVIELTQYTSIHVPEDKIKPIEQCEKCGKLRKKLKKCGRCNWILYCSKECQVDDWKEHKANCKEAISEPIVTIREGYPNSREKERKVKSIFD